MIPKPQKPSKAALEKVAKMWWQPLEPIQFGNWSKEVVANSIPFERVPLGISTIEKILQVETVPLHEIDPGFTHLTHGWYPFFAKLNSRSAKDACEGPYYSFPHMIAAFRQSLRTFEDLCHFHYLDCCEIVFRPWITIPKRDEWRMFVKDGELVGISQYHYFEVFEYEKRTERVVGWACEHIMKIINRSMPIKTYVCDVFITNDFPVLIEINPWGLSDPCLFESYQDFDGSFKINTVEY